MGERLSFIYLERCLLHRDDNAVTAEDAGGVTHIPAATIGTLLLGPGTRVTHQAMSLLGESGAGVVWVGEQGVRFYSGGRSLSRSSALVEAQASKWANRNSRLEVARQMYRIRFPGEDPSGLTRHELLGREADGSKTATAERRKESASHGTAGSISPAISPPGIRRTRRSPRSPSACTPIDHEGIILIRRPKTKPAISAAPPSGWSKAAQETSLRQALAAASHSADGHRRCPNHKQVVSHDSANKTKA
jgi:hypothetical protein